MLQVRQEGQLSLHLLSAVVESPYKVNEVRFQTGTERKIGTAERALTRWELLKIQPKREELAFERASSAKKRTAERALTHW